MKDEARAVVIGGGIVGVAVAEAPFDPSGSRMRS
jgi:hypothetical protein